MKSNQFAHCMVGLAAAIALLVLFGVNASTLVYLAAVLVCPLAMVFLMRGMIGGDAHGGCNHPDHHHHTSDTTDSRERQR